MKYPRFDAHYNTPMFNEKMMGPNPLKMEEELLEGNAIPRGATVMDLGSGQGITSVFMAKEYGFRVFATDLWSNPTDNMRFFEQAGLTNAQIVPIHADATALPYAEEFFDAIVSVDSYHYFGRDPKFLDEKLLPFVKHGGFLYFAVPGMHTDLHDNLPAVLLKSWTPEQLDYIHGVEYWKKMLARCEGAEIVSVREMQGNEELWRDWLACDNEYARGDRKTMEAGGGQYMNFVAMELRRK